LQKKRATAAAAAAARKINLQRKSSNASLPKRFTRSEKQEKDKEEKKLMTNYSEGESLMNDIKK